MQKYKRVIPRDLFNESKLLKCMGQLALLNHEGKDNGLLTIEHVNPTRGFDIVQDQSDGSLYVRNLIVRTKDGTQIPMGSQYNSKAPYPLMFTSQQEYGDVFTDTGEFSSEFKSLIGIED